eukprot:2032596-Rhodomonas_salina.1
MCIRDSTGAVAFRVPCADRCCPLRPGESVCRAGVGPEPQPEPRGRPERCRSTPTTAQRACSCHSPPSLFPLVLRRPSSLASSLPPLTQLLRVCMLCHGA